MGGLFRVFLIKTSIVDLVVRKEPGRRRDACSGGGVTPSSGGDVTPSSGDGMTPSSGGSVTPFSGGGMTPSSEGDLFR